MFKKCIAQSVWGLMEQDMESEIGAITWCASRLLKRALTSYRAAEEAHLVTADLDKRKVPRRLRPCYALYRSLGIVWLQLLESSVRRQDLFGNSCTKGITKVAEPNMQYVLQG